MSIALRRGWAAFLVLCGALLASSAGAADAVLPVPALSGRVIDQTQTLTPAQSQALSGKLEALETQHGAQVVVLLVPTTLPEDVFSYSQRVAETWKLGRRDVGDGVLVVVAKNDRRINISVAKTLEGAIPDVLAGRIIADQIKPAFQAGDYAGGLNAAVDRLSQRISGEGLPEPPQLPAGGRAARGPAGGFDLQTLAMFLFVGAPVVGGLLCALFGRKLGSVLTGAAVGGLAWLFTASALIAIGVALVALFLVGVVGLGSGRSFGGPVIFGGGGGGGGFGGGGGGGGGFSSGGGGSFGGGGASGSW